jgi:hypothetical protein
MDAILTGNPKALLREINGMNGPNIIVDGLDYKSPKILCDGPCAAAVVAFFGDVELFRLLVNLGFDHTVRDRIGRTLGQFAMCWRQLRDDS